MIFSKDLFKRQKKMNDAGVSFLTVPPSDTSKTRRIYIIVLCALLCFMYCVYASYTIFTFNCSNIPIQPYIVISMLNCILTTTMTFVPANTTSCILVSNMVCFGYGCLHVNNICMKHPSFMYITISTQGIVWMTILIFWSVVCVSENIRTREKLFVSSY